MRKKVVTEMAADIKEDFKLKLEATGRQFVLHFDGKILEDITGSTRSSQDRLAILLSSPALDAKQLLAVPAVAAGTGEEICKKVRSNRSV